MKLCVYSICKNEIKYVKKWLEKVKEADEVIVVDTGSTDGTWEILQQSGVKCYQKIFDYFRYDEAFNYALSLVPKDCDICLPLDFDAFMAKGFCEKIKNAWKQEYSVLYIPEYFNKTNESTKWYVHSRIGCQWKYPVYCQIIFNGEVGYCTDTILIHEWSPKRPSHDRFLELAKLGVKENPFDPYCQVSLRQIQNERENISRMT